MNASDEKKCNGELFHENLTEISKHLAASRSVTVLRTSDRFLFLGTSSGHLLTFDRFAGKPLKRLYCDSSNVTSIDVLSVNGNDAVYVAAGHQSGTVSFIRITACDAQLSMTHHFDMDSHKKKSVTDVAWDPDTSKLYSSDVDGLIVASTLDFDRNEFVHAFFFMTSSSTSILSIQNSLLIAACSASLVCISTHSCEVESSLSIDLEPIAVHSASNSIIVSTSRDVTQFSSCSDDKKVIEGVVRICPEELPIHSTVSSGSLLGVLLTTPVGSYTVQMYSVESWEKLSEIVVAVAIDAFCLDVDGSFLYLSRFPCSSVFRIGTSPASKQFTCPPPPTVSHSAFSGLLGSPTKLLSNVSGSGLAAVQRATAIVGGAVEAAVTASSQSEVSRRIGDGLSNLNAVVRTIQDRVDTSSSKDIVEGIPYLPVLSPTETTYTATDSTGITEIVGIVAESGLPVFRRTKGKAKKRGDSVSDDLVEIGSHPAHVLSSLEIDTLSSEAAALPVQLEDSVMNHLRRQVLGAPSLAGSVQSTPPMSPAPIECHQYTAAVEDGAIEIQNSSNVVAGCDESLDSPDMASSPALTLNLPTSVDPVSNPNPSVPVECGSLSPALYEAEHSLSTVCHRLLNNIQLEQDQLPEDGRTKAAKISDARRRSVTRRTVRVNDNCDIWNEYAMPFTIHSLCVNAEDELMLCHRKKKACSLPLDSLGTKNAQWKSLPWIADCIAGQLNKDMHSIRVMDGRCFYTVEISGKPPEEEEIAAPGEPLIEARLAEGGNDIWYISNDLGPCVLMDISQHAVFSHVSCEWPLKSLAVGTDAVWAIRSDKGSLVVRVGLNRCRMGFDWVEISPEGPSCLVSVDVCGSTGIGLDEAGRLWLAVGVDTHHPYGIGDAWLEVHHSWDLGKCKAPIDDWRVRLTADSLFVSAGKTLFVANTSVSAHRFQLEIPPKFDVLDNFSMISASSCSLEDDSLEADAIYLCRHNSEIFVYRPRRRNFFTVTLPSEVCAIVSISSSASSLSFIDSAGQMWRKEGEDGVWANDSMLKSRMSSYCESDLCQWGVTCEGVVVALPSGDDRYRIIASPPTMINDGQSEPGPMKIYISPNGQYVWLSDGVRAWARSDVTERTPCGIRWIETHHTCPITDLAVGDDVVWCLTEDGSLLRLKGLAAGNPSGNYWKMAARLGLRSISVDSHSCLWAINSDNRLVRHYMGMHPPDATYTRSSSGADSFELV